MKKPDTNTASTSLNSNHLGCGVKKHAKKAEKVDSVTPEKLSARKSWKSGSQTTKN